MESSRPAKSFYTLPNAWPILGNIQMLNGTFNDIAAEIGVLWIRMPSFLFKERMLHVETPELIHLILKKLDTDSVWPERWKRLLGPESIPVVSGAKHKRLRGLCSQAIKKSTIKSSLPKLQELAKLCLEDMVVASQAAEISPPKFLRKFTYDAICTFMAGADPASEAKLQSLFEYSLVHAAGFGDFFVPEWMRWWSGLQKGLTARQKILDGIMEVIVERRRLLDDHDWVPATTDLLSSMLQSKISENGEELYLKDSEIADSFITMMFAGMETTASVISSIMHVFLYEISEQDMKSVVAEVESLGPNFSETDILELPYLDALVKETMRKWATIPGGWRSLSKNTEFEGVDLPTGTLLSVSYERGHLHREHEVFKLSRFMGDDAFDKTNPKEFIPFGAGPRMCLGNNLASAEIKVFVAEMVRGFDLRKGSKPSVKITIPSIMMSPFLTVSRK
ncbi:cytochrome P450 [Rhizoclosmatium globosum]|uniref:Cytochrome P450 n=1 Tax=Rhizoclosmatium globosum TaxID=329046 RepID=A0A1Y2C6A3_9FUNG|nr:cytochrome P450 [Rhizoclosmatium globosum]|eukprot:ORY42569.1 cytochrome P450 [Rhizoclosmatium globosum]